MWRPTLTIGGQSVGRLPVFVAPQDVVGDVHVARSHVVDPLWYSYTAQWARRPPRPPSSSTACRRRAEWERRRSAVHPSLQIETRVKLTGTCLFVNLWHRVATGGISLCLCLKLGLWSFSSSLQLFTAIFTEVTEVKPVGCNLLMKRWTFAVFSSVDQCFSDFLTFRFFSWYQYPLP